MRIKKIIPKKKPIANKRPSSAVAKQPSFYLYRDPKFGFTLRLPQSWKTYTVVRRRTNLDDAEYGAFFLFKYQGKVYEDVLSILVFRMTKKEWLAIYEDSPVIFLAERNGLVYAYTVPGELPSDFLDPTGNDYDYKKYGKQIRLLTRMVNDDVPKIVKTLRFT
ncbi:hypothetical protein [Cohnella cholangitidis]|uniref:Uncharacterized protein n=1 Tax=Cohnella cholangitidis TaxID=2598458 RepID=A0A7G5BSA7_9BACL|nr:hypothetical protein [Cohnella cholangitidis]QMV39841.1 hypothetical protein FPL14_00430 [Cohnella cholangitidis]